MHAVPAQTVEGILAGMARVGVDVAAIRAALSLPDEVEAPDALRPIGIVSAAWLRAIRDLPRATLGAEIGLAVPYGAMGILDYLIASNDTLGAALSTLVAHFDMLGAAGVEVALAESDGNTRFEVSVSPQHPTRALVEEFSLALTLKNLRHIAADPLPVVAVRVTRPDPGTRALQTVLNERVEHGAETAALVLPSTVRTRALRTADPELQRVMRHAASAFGIRDDGTDAFLAQLRVRLRLLLPQGTHDARSMARALGLSERSLHRRLSERGTTWRAVVDTCRAELSKRLLADSGRPLVEVALAAGFSDQTTWTRAFRRWTGQSPLAWRRTTANRNKG